MDCEYRGPPLVNPDSPIAKLTSAFWCWQWELQSDWDKCPIGTVCENGGCVAVDVCSTTADQRCWYDEEGKFNSDKYWYIINCNLLDNGQMGFNEYNHTYCKWGCVDDFNTTTDTYIAHCINMSGEIVQARNIAEQMSSSFNIMIPGPFRFIFLVILAGIAFGLCAFYGKSPQLGLIGGVSVFGIGIIYSWVPIYVSLFFACLVGVIIFKRFYSEGDGV
jgi:hypothetical protein